MLENRLQHLHETEGLTPEERHRQFGTVEWEYRRGVRDDIEQITADVGRFTQRRGSLAEDVTAYITRRPREARIPQPVPAVPAQKLRT